MPSLKQIANYVKSLYNTGENIGEYLADIDIAYDYYNQMNETGRKLVNEYGHGAGEDIDNYYHPLLQCQIAKISDRSRGNGLELGLLKENYDFYKKRYIQGKDVEEIAEDSIKDLQNNLYGSKIGKENPYVSCLELLDDRRTENMRKANIR